MIPHWNILNERFLGWVGGIGFYWFLLTGFWGQDGHLVALGLIFLFFLYWIAPNWRLIRASSLFWLALCYSGYVALRAAAGYWADPGSLSWQLRFGWAFIGFGGLLSVFLLPWLIGSWRQKRLDRAFALVLVSLFIQVLLELLVHSNGISFSQLLNSRPGFQMGPNSFGYICGILLLGTVALGVRWLRGTKAKFPWPRTLAYGVVLMVVMGLLTAGLLLSQSRASWLATAVTLPFVILVTLWVQGEGWRNRGWITSGVLGGALLIGGGLIYSQWGLVEYRVFKESHTIRKLLSFDFSELPRGSIGNRILLWETGISAFPERPVSGWSPGGVKGLIEARTPFHYKHLHNMPLQIAVALGGVGFFLFFGMVLISSREVFKAIGTGRLPLEWGIFWLGALVFLAVEGLFDFPMHDKEVRFLLTLLGAVAMGVQLERLRQERPAHWISRGTEKVTGSKARTFGSIPLRPRWLSS
ncbi:O-antigen ligase family protein [Thiohalorhabdus sp. Cl-TMA]|uniref:O-antigen ligase family protein n=1 Tax=Thiohalorhabdus methylotrophus TaxID=3242694 RepID=A0ABV4TTB2_9GAMM